jgi:hypothetical protein
MEIPFGDGTAYRRFSYRAPEWQDLLERIDFEALVVERRRFEGSKSPRFATLDTSFFFSGFQSALRRGGRPKSIKAAQDGIVRLFLAEETYWELIRKLPEFAEELDSDSSPLEAIIADWAPLITIVTMHNVDDPRVDKVTERDWTDRPAARLASFLSPCFLLTTDNDFAAMEVALPGQPVLAIKAAIVAKDAEMTVHGMVTVPAIPAVAAWEGAKWGGSKLGVNPVLLIIGVIALGYVAYRVQPQDRRERIKKTVARLGKEYMDELGRAMEQNALAEKAVDAQLVPRTIMHTAESQVMHELARHDASMTAHEIYDAAGLRNEVSVKRVREILNTHESTWKCPGRGQWSFGIPLDEYRSICGQA